MRGFEGRILRLCRTVQATVPGYGAARLESTDLFHLLIEAGLNVATVEDLSLPALPLPPKHPTKLLVRAGLPEVVQQYVALREIGDLLSPTDVPPVIPTVFALCGVLNYGIVESDAAPGPRTRREVIAQLRSVPELWEVVSFPYMLRLTREVLRKLVLPELEGVDPAEGWLAYEQGLEARRASNYVRAAERFGWAAKIARKYRDWELLARAQLGFAKTSKQRGNYRVARRLLRRALETARRYGVAVVEGMALQDLFALAGETGEHLEALHRAEEAFWAYREIRHPNLLRLAHDIGRHYLDIGDYRSALTITREVLPHLRRGEDVMLVWGNIARAAAGLRDRELFEEACAEVDRAAASAECEEHLARSLLEAAVGAAHLGLWERAEAGALRALEVAVRRGEAVTRFEAEALLNNVRVQRTGEISDLPPSRRRSELAQEIVEALRELGAMEGTSAGGESA